jgi:hypothetical protein
MSIEQLREINNKLKFIGKYIDEKLQEQNNTYIFCTTSLMTLFQQINTDLSNPYSILIENDYVMLIKYGDPVYEDDEETQVCEKITNSILNSILNIIYKYYKIYEKETNNQSTSKKM